MITPSFGLTATERVLPRLALDFTTASLDSRVTFTRSGNTATVINSSGNIAVSTANTPRFDYNPTTLVCNGLLIEESRINSIRNNTMVGTVAGTPGTLPTNWSNYTSVTGLTFTIVGTGVETGITYIDLQISGTPSAGGIFNINYEAVGGIAGLTGQTWTASAYRKIAAGSIAGIGGIRFGLTEYNAVSAQTANTFSPSYPTITTAALITQRASATITTSGGATTAFLLPYDQLILTGAAVNLTLRIGLPQFEQGAFATSVISTTTTSVTRNADVAVMTGTNFSDWYTATTGAAVVWATPQAATGTRPLIQFDDTTALEIITLRGNIADPELYIVDGGVAQAQIDAGTIVANTAYKLSGGWDTNNCAAAKDGGTVGTDTSATMPTPTQLRIGSDGTNYASAVIQKIMYWKQRIINAEVQAFSK